MLVLAAFVVLTLASARATRLITEDKISFPLRQKAANKFGANNWFVYLIHCPFCTSVWVCFAATAFGILLTPVSWWWLVPGALAMSYLVAPVLKKLEG